MAYIDEQLFRFKAELEAAILARGVKGKESIIRSSALINLIHDAVKYELIQNGIAPSQIYPHFGETKPEMKIAGFLKQKDQDVCVAPKNIAQVKRRISWGPLANENVTDIYGEEYTRNTLKYSSDRDTLRVECKSAVFHADFLLLRLSRFGNSTGSDASS